MRPGFHVLDLGFGRGGDMGKFENHRPGLLVGSDISIESLREATTRYNQKHMTFPMQLIHASFSEDDIAGRLQTQNLQFHLVTAQFCMHYAFANEQMAHRFFENAGARLLPGHYFIATIPNAPYIAKRLIKSKTKSFGNSLFSIEFEQLRFPAFGAKYRFKLRDAVDADEYLVHPNVMERVARAHGLEFKGIIPFAEFYQSTVHPGYHRREEFIDLLHKLRVPDEKGTIPDDEWEISCLYSIAIFLKSGRPRELPSDPGQRDHTPLQDSAIIRLMQALATATAVSADEQADHAAIDRMMDEEDE